jgi:hypothetical protein
MTFDELWKTLPIPFGYEHMNDLDKARWKAIVEAAFRTGLFEGTHKSASDKTADSKRISDLEAAVDEIRAAMAVPKQIGPIDSRAKDMESALKVIHTWCCFPDQFGFETTKRLCMSALGREQ